MTHLVAFVLCLAGFAALALATRRQQRDVIGRSLPLPETYVLRSLGASALLAGLGILVAWQGWGFGLVTFSGHSSINAGIVYCMLFAYARMNSSTVWHR